MALGIEGSKLVLVFITKEYADKVNGKAAKQLLDNCFLEFK